MEAEISIIIILIYFLYLSYFYRNIYKYIPINRYIGHPDT